MTETEVTQAVELMLCPFCGSKCMIAATLDDQYRPMCRTDGCAALDGYNKRAEAIAAWNTRTQSAAQNVPVLLEAIPSDIVEQVLRMGRAEWGATEELTSEGHLANLETTLRLTREHFNYADIPVKMHGLYLDGTETVLCHTGTSPNSPMNAQALTGAWNWLHDQCTAIAQAQETQ